MTTTQEAACPKCNGPMWDNRATKKNPKQPDFKCKDKAGCDGVIWPPKPGASPYAAPRTAPAKAPVSLGGPLPWEQPVAPLVHPEYGDEAAQQKAVDALKANRLDALFTLYRACFMEATSVAHQGLPNATPEAIAAMTATLFIAAKDRAA